MDWGSAADWVSAGANVVVSVLAWVALGTWQRETVGKKNIEIAEDTLVRIRDLVESLKRVRRYQIVPIREIEGYDGSDRAREAMEVSKKIEALKPTMTALEAHKHVLKPRFGAEAQTVVTKTLLVAWRMYSTANAYTVPRPLKPEDEETERLIFDYAGDTLEKELDRLAKDADRIFGSYLSGR